jgi:hypothetical protein
MKRILIAALSQLGPPPIVQDQYLFVTYQAIFGLQLEIEETTTVLSRVIARVPVNYTLVERLNRRLLVLRARLDAVSELKESFLQFQ